MNWLDWEDGDAAFRDFTAGLIALRRSRPLLTPNRFLHAEDGNPEGRFVTWRRRDGTPMDGDAWHREGRRNLALLIQGREDRALFLMLNAGTEPVPYDLPAGPWHVLVDTVADRAGPERGATVEGDVTVGARALLLLEADAPGPVHDHGEGEDPHDE
jgi:glycogen operon protein